MTVVVCLDERGGMAFNKRRQSSDSVVTEDILDSACGRLIVYPYSEKLIRAAGGVCRVSDDALAEAGKDDFVLLEDRRIGEAVKRVEGLIIYRWNRHYPSDLRFDITPESAGLRLVSTDDLVGSSHEKITKEVYVK